MKRLTCAPRPDWQKLVEADGMVWHTPFWSETAYYSLTKGDVSAIGVASETLYKMFLDAGAHVIENDLFEQFEIPEWVRPLIVKAWQREPPCLNYGRFDLGYNPNGDLKLFEFNCDTPTSLLEAAIIQWRWKEALFPKLGQSNEIHESFQSKWKDIVNYLPSRDIYVMAVDDPIGEDIVTATYMAEFMTEVGLKPVFIKAEDVGYDSGRKQFVDLGNKPISTMYKLYPWEWMFREEFGQHIVDAPTVWIEPVWKAIWSNKAILPILWKLFPDHPLLLESSTEPLQGEQVIKPIFGREGRGVRFSGPNPEPTLGRDIYQKKFDVQPHDGQYPVIGSWIVDGYFSGIGIREGGPITSNTSTFMPHVIES